MTGERFDSELIEHIVREVVRRLLDRGVNVQCEANQTGRNEMTVTDRVVVLSSIEGRLDGVRRVVVDGQAVVTPAARDELKDKGVELTRR